MRISTIFIIVLTSIISLKAQDQEVVLEELAARLGGEILLASELKSQLDYQAALGGSLSKYDSCNVIQDMFLEKLLVDQAKRSEEHTSELQSRGHLVCRLLLEKKKEHYTSLEAQRAQNPTACTWEERR